MKVSTTEPIRLSTKTRAPRSWAAAIWHRLTPKGQSVLKKGYDVIAEVLEGSFGPLSGRQREELYRFLKRALEDGEPAQRVGF